MTSSTFTFLKMSFFIPKFSLSPLWAKQVVSNNRTHIYIYIYIYHIKLKKKAEDRRYCIKL